MKVFPTLPFTSNSFRKHQANEKKHEDSQLPGEGANQQRLYGEAPPRFPTPYPFIYDLWHKRYIFRIRSIEKWGFFHIPTNSTLVFLSLHVLAFKV